MEKIGSAPQWLKDRMKKSRERPAPSADVVERQFQSVKNARIAAGYKPDCPDCQGTGDWHTFVGMEDCHCKRSP